jgi:thiamine kinase-like enzyme
MQSQGTGAPRPSSTRTTIEQIIARIPSWRQASSVTVAPLPGGITNLNYRVDVDDQAFVVRIWAPKADLLGINRQREYRCTLAAARAGVAPEVVHFLPAEGIMITRFLQGRGLSPQEMAQPDVMARVVQAMRRYYGAEGFEGSFSAFDAIVGYVNTARRLGVPLPADIKAMQAQVLEISAALRRGQTIVGPCHNDLWGPNLIDDGESVRVVDWEYAGTGDVCFDLANFAIHHASPEAGDEPLLRAYFGEVTDALVARVKLLKIVADLREALWYLIALRVSADTTDFTRRAERHFARTRGALEDPHVPRWLIQTQRKS